VESLHHPADKRIKMIRLTPKGLELSERSHKKMVRRQQEMIADLTPEDLEELNRLLDKVYQNMQKSE
jgi:DNA-binding MarR family transcriptional regulator